MGAGALRPLREEILTEVVIAYESERATLYHARAEDALPLIPKGSVDLLATDPPYGVAFRSSRGGDGGNFDTIANDRPENADAMAAIVADAVRRLRSGRHAYVFGPDHLVAGLPLGGVTELIWDKTVLGMGGQEAPWRPAHEPITFGVYTPSQANRASGYGRMATRLRQGSVLAVMRPHSRGARRHPTEKPVALMRQLIESSSCLGETVLDPFAGCGSTLVAAVLEGRKAIGIELDAGYCATAVRRLRWAERVADLMAEDGEDDGPPAMALAASAEGELPW